jgi:polysaccharide biosynthesis protein PslG
MVKCVVCSFFALILLLPSCMYGQQTSGTPVVPTFFGLVTNKQGAGDFPQVPFGAMRLWDTGTQWKDLEPSSGVFNWGYLDKWVAEAKANNKEVLLTLAGVPTWAGGGSTFASPPSDVDTGDQQWQTFITALVTRYQGQIAYYDGWNEPDLKQRWLGSPAQMVTMMKDAYTIIHTIDPAAKVVGPSPSTGNQWNIHFLPDYYAAGGAPYQDVIGMHSYIYTNGVMSTTPEGILIVIKMLKTLLAQYQIGNLPIFFTEGSYGGVPNNSGLTYPQKVDYIGREYALMLANGITRYYWYSWDNTGFGTMWTSSGGVNPVGVAYGTLYKWLVGSTFVSLTQQSGTQVMTLTLADGTSAQIVWNISASVQYATTFANIGTLDGATNPVVGGVVTVSTTPVFLSGTAAPPPPPPPPLPHTYTIFSANYSSDGNTAVILGEVDGVPVAAYVAISDVLQASGQSAAALQNLLASAMMAAKTSATNPPRVDPVVQVPLGTFTQ